MTMQQLHATRSEPLPKYGPYPGTTIAPNYPIQSPPHPPHPPPPHSPPQPYSAPHPPPPSRPTSPARYYARPPPSDDDFSDDTLSLPHKSSSIHLPSSSRPSSPRRDRRRSRSRSGSPAEASYVCVDGVCTRLEPGTRTVMLVEHPGRNLSGYLILAIFVMLCCNICFGLFAVIFAILAMSDGVEHSRSMQLGEASLCFSVSGILCTLIIVFIVILSLT